MKNDKIKLYSLLTIMVFTLSLLLSQVVFADNAGLGPNDKQNILVLPESKEGKAKKREMELDSQKLIDVYYNVKEGKAEPEDYWNLLNEFKKKWKTSKSEINKDTQNVGILTAKQLYVSAYEQLYGNYCGPASAQQFLAYKGISRNPYDLRQLTQPNLADDLHTDSSGTSFPGYWTGTLQNWTSGIEWASLWAPSASTLLAKTKIDVDANWPLIYDTHMNSKNGYLPGYSTYDFWHYVTGAGYNDTSGSEQIYYVDPNNFRQGTFGGHWVSLSLMTSVLKDRGIIW
ncbi:MAG: C39 family peptidase [Peptococcaceae bacterium]|nr:C39 family peptidase [Peptococcaceae bacterium]